MKLCLSSGLESKKCKDRRQKQHGRYDRENDLKEDIETFRGEKLEIFVSGLESLLMTTKDSLNVYVSARLCSIVGRTKNGKDVAHEWWHRRKCVED